MTDRIDRVTVILDRDYRDDDVLDILDALRMTKGVLDVRQEIQDGSGPVAEVRRDTAWRQALHNLARRGPG